MHGVSFSRKQSGITPFVYKALIFRTAKHQQISCPFKYCTSVRHIDPYEISTWCTHLNEQCFQREKKSKEQIIIKLMEDETSLKIPLCSKLESVISNGYLKTSKAVDVIVSLDNLSGYLSVY